MGLYSQEFPFLYNPKIVYVNIKLVYSHTYIDPLSKTQVWTWCCSKLACSKSYAGFFGHSLHDWPGISFFSLLAQLCLLHWSLGMRVSSELYSRAGVYFIKLQIEVLQASVPCVGYAIERIHRLRCLQTVDKVVTKIEDLQPMKTEHLYSITYENWDLLYEYASKARIYITTQSAKNEALEDPYHLKIILSGCPHRCLSCDIDVLSLVIAH